MTRYRSTSPTPDPEVGLQSKTQAGASSTISDAELKARHRAMWATRDVLEVTAFERPRDFGEHFKARYGPTIAAQANARRSGRDAEFEAALDQFCDEWNCGTADRARFELEYLLAVGTG